LFLIGVDLGTTNCGVAWTTAAADGPVENFPIPQLTAPGEVRAEPLLESSLYLAQSGEFAAGALDLPWNDCQDFAVGRLAARRGTEVLGRLVTSAKSWLCHGGVDRQAAILPVNAPAGGRRVSPVEASRRYLEHIRAAWNHAHEDAPFEKQKILLTVPASFDEVARKLTEQAAHEAGYRHAVLLEEPQAAFYAWLERHADWRERIGPGAQVLVVDVGGGTTDLTLIAVTDRKGELALERVAVGEHLLLGGDNMDLALAHTVAAELAAQGKKLDAMQMHGLWQQCRRAKERLLSAPEAAEEPVTILGRGTGLIGGTLRAKLRRAEVERLLVDGFFPMAGRDDMPQREHRSGLVEAGLPYEQDAAITRHLAQFLRRHDVTPTHVLFNGGVFQAAQLRSRVAEVLDAWLAAAGRPPVEVLTGEDLMHAVARGAAYYGRARDGQGVRIRGGIARTYYIGVETAMPAVPGFAAPLKALAVAPFGMEEGSAVAIPDREFGLVVGEPAEFRFFASAVRKHDAAGELIDDFGDELAELAPVKVELPAEGASGGVVRVTLEARVTAVGVLELWSVARDGRRWKLEFQVREKARR
jgi:molecular chaperone DnaK (HSP70)